MSFSARWRTMYSASVTRVNPSQHFQPDSCLTSLYWFDETVSTISHFYVHLLVDRWSCAAHPSLFSCSVVYSLLSWGLLPVLNEWRWNTNNADSKRCSCQGKRCSCQGYHNSLVSVWGGFCQKHLLRFSVQIFATLLINLHRGLRSSPVFFFSPTAVVLYRSAFLTANAQMLHISSMYNIPLLL